MPDAWDDELLVASLRQALNERREVPPGMIEFARNAFAWYNVHAELAELVYDSSHGLGQEPEPSVRAETASLRALTFRSPHITVEVEVTADSLVGQVVPAQPATITVQPRQGTERLLAAEQIGCFSIEPSPAGMIRLRLETADAIEAVTPWFEL